MKNIKSFDKFNEELSTSTYSSIASAGQSRNDPRGNRIANTAKTLMSKHSVVINLYNRAGAKFKEFKPNETIQKYDSFYKLESPINPDYVVFEKNTSVYSTMSCTFNSTPENIYFDNAGRSILLGIFEKSGIAIKKSEIPTI